MNKEDLQRRAGILTEGYFGHYEPGPRERTMRSSGVDLMALEKEGGLMWEPEFPPPEPSATEQAQVDAGRIDFEIAEVRRRAGIAETDITECPPEALAIKNAAAKDIHEELAELAKFIRFIPDQYKDKFDDRLDSIAHHLEDIQEQM